jgi:excisionase family DNA binding protein
MTASVRYGLRPAEFAASIGMSKRYVYKQIADGALVTIKLGRARIIRPRDAERWLSREARRSARSAA